MVEVAATEAAPDASGADPDVDDAFSLAPSVVDSSSASKTAPPLSPMRVATYCQDEKGADMRLIGGEIDDGVN